MRVKLYLAVFFVFITGGLFSQSVNQIKGQVINASGGTPLVNCSVFINSTSKGTVTGSSGEFVLSNIPAGKFELIVSSIGYETYVFPFSSNQLPLDLKISLKEKATDLSAVTVEPFLKDGWETWGRTFIENFIGTTDFAISCSIRNKEVIRFRYSKKKDLLSAIADEPVIVENRALGYIISFKLEEFSVDFKSLTNVYLGYPFFSEMPATSKVLQMEWQDNRKKAYLGSIMHFIRSLYSNEIKKPDMEFNPEGFELMKPTKLANTEKSRMESKYALHQQQHDDPWPGDSLKYYKKLMRQPDSLVRNQFLSAENLVTINDDQTKYLYFTGKLSVTYRIKRKFDKELQKSVIYLLTPAPVEIEENGYYDSPLEIFMAGYWSRSQKLASILPLDYWPDE